MFQTLELLARRSFPLVVLLTLAGAGMLFVGASDDAMNLFSGAYFTVAAPPLLIALARRVVLWRDSKRPPEDVPQELR